MRSGLSFLIMHNIFKLYSAWTCWAWIIWLLAAGVSFAVLETLGLRRWHGAIPLTWVVRDSLPRIALWLLCSWLLFHFGIETNTNQPAR